MTEPGKADTSDDIPPPSDVRLTIDGMEFRVQGGSMTGADIRRLAHPPIESDRDIFVETQGGSDRIVGDHDAVVVTDGMRVFTVPVQITMGSYTRGD